MSREHLTRRLKAARQALEALKVDLENEAHQTLYASDEDDLVRFADRFSGVARACELARFMLGTNESPEEVE